MSYLWAVFGLMATGLFAALFAYAIYLALTSRRD